ncbi:MAG: hypothetical protein RBS77_05215 [Candidatus Moranbacteria bacterium]|jgi:hypothetical protein|nr:hypothetical protein [Candidatus Moranbacteria bacterium]
MRIENVNGTLPLEINAPYQIWSETQEDFFKVSSAESGMSKGVQSRWKIELWGEKKRPFEGAVKQSEFLAISNVPFWVHDKKYQIYYKEEMRQYVIERLA